MRRPNALSVLSVAAALLLAACGGSASGDNPSPTRTVSPGTATPSAPDLTIFTGFTFPIASACLPQSDQLMPNAPRDYRAGVHEGIDFYAIDNCTTIERNTPVLAAKDGVIVRADHEYHDLTRAELDAANQRIADGDANAPEVLDLFRGRQVWIEHVGGIITRYAHLEGVKDGIVEGDRVRAGDEIAYTGDSGTPESISNPDTENHLHFELRAGDAFLGAGAPPEEVRALYERLFGSVDAP